MYDIFTYIWLIFMVNVGKYPIHGSYGYYIFTKYVSFKYLTMPAPLSVWGYKRYQTAPQIAGIRDHDQTL